MIPRDVKAPTIPISFHKFLKVVAIVDEQDSQTKQLLEQIAAQNFEIEVSASFDRDVSEDAAVGAYIAMIDGDRLDKARNIARAVRANGFQTPLWGLANAHSISDLAVLVSRPDQFRILGLRWCLSLLIGGRRLRGNDSGGA